MTKCPCEVSLPRFDSSLKFAICQSLYASCHNLKECLPSTASSLASIMDISCGPLAWLSTTVKIVNLPLGGCSILMRNNRA